jgi:hypothetical protein
MMKRCTACGKGLGFWDRIKSRIDHPECWESAIVKRPADNEQANLRLSKQNGLLKFAQILSPSLWISR